VDGGEKMNTIIIIFGTFAMMGTIMGIINYLYQERENVLRQKMKAEFDLELDTVNKIIKEILQEQAGKEEK
jgi:hypothetical protein